jgi:hypothetical protein
MDRKLQEQIYTTFPEFFESVKSEEKDTIHSPQYLFGIECDNGWYNLIYKLFFDLDQTIINYDLKHLKSCKSPQIHQIKEKFGGLRFYVSGATEEQYKIIEKAEEESYHICEQCGCKGKLRDVYGWYWTFCKKCLIKNLHKRYHDNSYKYLHPSYSYYLMYTIISKIKNIRWKLKNYVPYYLAKYYQKCHNYLRKLLSQIMTTL